MKQFSILFAALIAVFFLSALGGCVTAHEATVEFRAVDFHDGGRLDGCYLLTIESCSTEKVGSWWIVGQDSGGSSEGQMVLRFPRGGSLLL